MHASRCDPLTWIAYFQIWDVLLATHRRGPQAPQFFAVGPVGWSSFLLVGGFCTLNVRTPGLVTARAPLEESK